MLKNEPRMNGKLLSYIKSSEQAGKYMYPKFPRSHGTNKRYKTATEIIPGGVMVPNINKHLAAL